MTRPSSLLRGGLVAACAVLCASPGEPLGPPEARAANPVVIVSLRAGQDPEPVAREATRRWGGRIRHIYRAALSGFAAELPSGAAMALARDPRVLAVEPDRPVRLVASGSQATPRWGLDRVDQRDLPRDLGYAWGACGECLADLNADGVVDGADLGVLLGAWG